MADEPYREILIDRLIAWGVPLGDAEAAADSVMAIENPEVAHLTTWHDAAVRGNRDMTAEILRLRAENRDLRWEAKTAHQRLVVMSAEIGWATDGHLSTAVRHVEELVRRRTTERDDALHQIEILNDMSMGEEQ